MKMDWFWKMHVYVQDPPKESDSLYHVLGTFTLFELLLELLYTQMSARAWVTLSLGLCSKENTGMQRQKKSATSFF